jgi:glutathione peroxidase-family protein
MEVNHMESTIYEFNANDIKGTATNLVSFKDKVVLIVNVASKCGFTPQYEGLEKLYEKYRDRGFVVLGFPANNFLGQEPGTNDEIANFCSLTYNVSFPMFAKISVKGKDIHPLYAFLTDKKRDPAHGGAITWNFNKFLVDRSGKVVGRFDSKVKPDDPALVTAIEKAL